MTMPCLPGCLRPCRATFERLAREAPELLIAWVQTGYGLGDADLSFACEALGEGLRDDERRWLRARLAIAHWINHESPIVREGVVLGISALIQGPTQEVVWLAQHDPSPGVREAAQDALDSLSAPAREAGR